MNKIEIPVLRFRFEVTALEDIPFPQFRGSTFRGAFGTALKDTVEPQIYYDIFESYNASEIPDPDMSSSLPNPYLFETSDFSGKVEQGHTFEIGFSLFGRRMRYVEECVNAIARASEHGFSYERKKSQISRIYQVYADGSEKLLYDGRHIIITSQLDKHFTVNYPTGIKCVELEFLTPTRIMKNNLPLMPGNFNLHDFFSVLITRINLIYHLYAFHPFEDDHNSDFKFYEEKIKSLRIYSNQLKVMECARYSNRQQKHVNLTGITGRIIITGKNLDDLIRYLIAGQYLHVGHAAVMGLGQYKIRFLDFSSN